jgi:hypothetical protein
LGDPRDQVVRIRSEALRFLGVAWLGDSPGRGSARGAPPWRASARISLSPNEARECVDARAMPDAQALGVPGGYVGEVVLGVLPRA